MLVSSSEATAVNLIGFCNHVCGLDQVATILSELADILDPDKLVKAAQTESITWAQCCGYLLEFVDAETQAQALKAYVNTNARLATLLLQSLSQKLSKRAEGWKLDINTDVEVVQ